MVVIKALSKALPSYKLQLELALGLSTRVPDWVRFIAVDPCGAVYAYETQPTWRGAANCWSTPEQYTQIADADTSGLQGYQLCYTVAMHSPTTGKVMKGGALTPDLINGLNTMVSAHPGTFIGAGDAEEKPESLNSGKDGVIKRMGEDGLCVQAHADNEVYDMDRIAEITRNMCRG